MDNLTTLYTLKIKDLEYEDEEFTYRIFVGGDTTDIYENLRLEIESMCYFRVAVLNACEIFWLTADFSTFGNNNQLLVQHINFVFKNKPYPNISVLT